MKQQKISEKQIRILWQYYLGEEVADTGELVKIIYPGRQSHDSGPDFHDAVITINGRKVRGDVEVHTDSSHWFRHRHHCNPQYNQTVLHIVLNHTTTYPVITEQGFPVPTVQLTPFSDRLSQNLHQSLASSFNQLPCLKTYHPKSKLVRLLAIAGRERFELKVNRFKEKLNKDSAEQVLLSGVMRALGYARNTKPFEELSRRLCFNFSGQLKTRNRVAMEQAYLLGTAGLLPCQRQQRWLLKDKEATKLEKLWRAIEGNQTMNEADWQFAGVRPPNFPVRRLIALSYLLRRYHNTGLLHGILNQVTQTSPESGPFSLESSLLVTASGYWAKHFDFGLAAATNSALLGKNKAAEIAINVVLPFTYAWADMVEESELREKAGSLFCTYPRLSDNEITRHMRQQLHIKDSTDISLVHQQGLLHIFTTYCRDGNCQECPILIHPS